MEFIKESPPVDEGTRIVHIRQYANVSSSDLLGLRSQAAAWAFGRDLTVSENEQIIKAESNVPLPLVDVPTLELVVQEEPRITLKINSSGLTGEQFGYRRLGERLSLLQYHRNDIRQGVGTVLVNCFQYRQAVLFSPLEFSSN